MKGPHRHGSAYHLIAKPVIAKPAERGADQMSLYKTEK